MGEISREHNPIRWCNNSSVISNYPIGDTPGGTFNLPYEESG
jgi:hypothetical protein